MQKHSDAVDVGIGVEMIDARGIECAGAANDPVHFVALLQQQVGEITAILSGNAGDERLLHVDLSILRFNLSLPRQQMI